METECVWQKVELSGGHRSLSKPESQVLLKICTGFSLGLLNESREL